jgi:hypothetical protein
MTPDSSSPNNQREQNGTNLTNIITAMQQGVIAINNLTKKINTIYPST